MLVTFLLPHCLRSYELVHFPPVEGEEDAAYVFNGKVHWLCLGNMHMRRIPDLETLEHFKYDLHLDRKYTLQQEKTWEQVQAAYTVIEPVRSMAKMCAHVGCLPDYYMDFWLAKMEALQEPLLGPHLTKGGGGTAMQLCVNCKNPSITAIDGRVLVVHEFAAHHLGYPENWTKLQFRWADMTPVWNSTGSTGAPWPACDLGITTSPEPWKERYISVAPSARVSDDGGRLRGFDGRGHFFTNPASGDRFMYYFYATFVAHSHWTYAYGRSGISLAATCADAGAASAEEATAATLTRSPSKSRRSYYRYCC